MKNHISQGVNVTLPAPADVLSGEMIVIGALYGVADSDAATGEDLDLVTRGMFELPKVASDVFAIGDKVYWNSSTKLVAKFASGGNTLIGVAVSDAADPSATVNVRLI